MTNTISMHNKKTNPSTVCVGGGGGATKLFFIHVIFVDLTNTITNSYIG